MSSGQQCPLYQVPPPNEKPSLQCDVTDYRVLTAREHQIFRQRERQLEPPGQDDEEDMEDEEEDEEEEEDREQQTTTTTTKKEDAGEREDEEEKQGSEKHSDSDSQSDRSRSRYVKQLTLALNGMEFPFFLKKKCWRGFPQMTSRTHGVLRDRLLGEIA